MTTMSKFKSVKDLPDSGVFEHRIDYLSYVYNEDGRIGIVRNRFEDKGETYFSVDFHGCNKLVHVIETELTHVPSHPVFDAYINNLMVFDLFDEKGDFNADERIAHVVESFDGDSDIDMDTVCLCPYSYTHFELNSKTGEYRCIAGVKEISTYSLREAAKLAFEWAWAENGLLDDDSEFLKFLASTHSVKGITNKVHAKFLSTFVNYFDAAILEASGAVYHQSGSFVSKAVQSVRVRNKDGELGDNVFTIEADPETFDIKIDVDGDSFAIDGIPFDIEDSFGREIRLMALLEMLKELQIK